MARALELAQKAFDAGEVPVGAVVVRDQKIIGEGWNSPISRHDATAHAEILALRQASQTCQNYRLPDTTLYVTIEPCTMCVGALVHARIARVVFGAREPKAGALVSQMQLMALTHWNHVLDVVSGVAEEPASALMQRFFQQRRAQLKAQKQLLKQDLAMAIVGQGLGDRDR